jgi:hypothetical protein
MRTLKYTFRQDGDFFLGFLNDYPDYATQAYSREALLEHLKDLLRDLESGEMTIASCARPAIETNFEVKR